MCLCSISLKLNSKWHIYMSSNEFDIDMPVKFKFKSFIVQLSHVLGS